MIIRIDQASLDPVYQQIRDQIVSAIARGELRPADKLPSVRSLASDLGINLHTVNKAYAVLRDEGHVLMRGRAGAIIADFQQTATPERVAANAEKLAANLYRLALEHCAQGGSEQEFLAEAQAQARRAFSDPGIVGTKRDINVLGTDPEGTPLKAKAIDERRKTAHAADAAEGA